MNKKKEIDKQKLYKLYVEDGLLLKDIQKIFNVSKNTLDKRFIEYGISKRNNRKSFEITKDELYDLYINKNMTALEIGNKMGRTQCSVEKKLKKYGIKKPKELFYKKNKEIVLERYGIENISQLKKVKEKKKQKSIEKYGVSNVSQAQEIKNKKEQKALDKFGVRCVLQAYEIKEKKKNTFLQKYGVENPGQVKEIRQKAKTTMLKKYGVEYAGQLEEFKEKIKKTNLQKYGVECVFQAQNIKDKIEQTNLKKYGKKYLGQIREFRIKAVKNAKNSRSKIDGKRFDSSYERDFYDYCLKNNIKVNEVQVPIKYKYNGVKHTTFIDFKVKGHLIECKGGHLLEGIFDYAMEVPIERKLDLYIENNVKIITDKKGIDIIRKYTDKLIVENIEHFRS